MCKTGEEILDYSLGSSMTAGLSASLFPGYRQSVPVGDPLNVTATRTPHNGFSCTRAARRRSGSSAWRVARL